MLRLVLADDKGDAPPGVALAHSRTCRDRGDDVLVRGVEDLLRRVEAQPVEMVFVDPVAGIGEKELAHRAGVGAVEIDRGRPIRSRSGR